MLLVHHLAACLMAKLQVKTNGKNVCIMFVNRKLFCTKILVRFFGFYCKDFSHS